METKNRSITMINPKIMNKSNKTFEVWDSCFSADCAFFGKTIRFKNITVIYFNENEEEIHEIFSDELSELFQHEIDHLDGILFTDHVINNQIIMRSEWENLKNE
jgi:peptide deformylase